MWIAYRDATEQLNLNHAGWLTSCGCPVDAGCDQQKETSAHIMWECRRATVTWCSIFERWTDKSASREDQDLLLTHIANRAPSPTRTKIRNNVQQRFGFYTEDHEAALATIWLIIVVTVPATLWRLRNKAVHQGEQRTPEECSALVWTVCSKQIRAVARRRQTLRGQRHLGLSMEQCWIVLDARKHKLQDRGWRSARLYFDRGARGNPGPGGSGWALLAASNEEGGWDLAACGYKYQGEHVTNNFCEYEALRARLAHAQQLLRLTATHLEVYGDSGMIIDARNGQAATRSTHLKETATRVTVLAGRVTWTTWHHVRREHNKMADTLANIAMDLKSSATLQRDETDEAARRFQDVQAWVGNDTRGCATERRDTSIADRIRMWQGF